VRRGQQVPPQQLIVEGQPETCTAGVHGAMGVATGQPQLAQQVGSVSDPLTVVARPASTMTLVRWPDVGSATVSVSRIASSLSARAPPPLRWAQAQPS
jgi:hypothetical protein